MICKIHPLSSISNAINSKVKYIGFYKFVKSISINLCFLRFYELYCRIVVVNFGQEGQMSGQRGHIFGQVVAAIENMRAIADEQLAKLVYNE